MPKRKDTKISYIIPAKDEEHNILPLYEKLSKEANKVSKNYEIIFIDDGSTDSTIDKIRDIGKKDRKVVVIKLRGNWGKSVALQSGFNIAKGDIIFTLDADLQDDPTEIPNFLKKLSQGYDLVSGWKKVRHDPALKVIPSRILNYIIRIVTGVKIHDINCGFKAYRKEVIQNINLYGELYRFIPVFAAKQNFRITEIPIVHHKRKFGKSKYGLEKNVKGLLDLITIIFLTGYIRRPGHFFGGLGLISFGLGFIIGLYITYLRITTGSIQYRHPLLFLGILLMVIGVQLVTTGLIAEMLVSFKQKESGNKSYIDLKNSD